MLEKRPDANALSNAATFLTQDPNEIGVLLGHEIEYRNSSISSLLHKKLQEVKEMDDELAAMKDSCAERLRNVKEGEKRFAKKQADMKKSIEAFESYIMDTDNKRMRAIKKTAEQRKIRETKEVQLEKLKETLEEIRNNRNSMVYQLRHLKRYENFLAATVRSEPHWHNIDELLNRYRVLVTANNDLSESASRINQQLEESQIRLQRLLKEKTNEILVLNSEVAQYMTKLEESSNRIQQTETEVAKIDLTTIGIASRMAQIQMSTTNLYTRVLQSYEQRRPKAIEPDASILDKDRQDIDYLSRLLNEIGDRLIEVTEICDEYSAEAVTASKISSAVKPPRTRRIERAPVDIKS
uniref:DUF4200 domain-containing protein n=1 Tax=Spongospora subterranea TaxID=70186 RepID=A0A0H5RAN4_9EUKA|eukprot:CRZ05529.1 hypothetical protein [Spongospora subterranea]